MKALLYIFSVLLTICGTVEIAHAQVSPQTPSLEAKRWKDSQLIEPAVLVSDFKANTSHAIIFNMGPMEDIKGAKHIGPGRDEENIDKLKKEVATLPKNAELIVYCGCCPLESKCPNARPAYDELIKLGFTNVKVLDLATNLKTNWIDEGYPLAGK
jgi:hypothetical protein